jgi:hypothetical protein
MDVPAMYYVGLGFNCFLLLLSLGGYYYVSRKTGKKWDFLAIFAGAWAISAVSYVFLIYGAASGAWYITLLRVLTYLVFVATLLAFISESVRPGKNAA